MQQAGFLNDDAALAQAIEDANLPTLALVMIHLTGDTELMRRGLRFKRASGQRMDGGLDEATARELRERALAVLRAYRDSGAPAPALPSDDVLHEMMSFSLGQAVPSEYVPLMIEDMHLRPSSSDAAAAAAAPSDFHVVVIGAGASGIVVSIELSRMGIAHTVIEKNADVGGTWLENTYPGCRVDLPSHFYAMSFEPNPTWSAHYAPREEIFAYMKRVADKHRVRDSIRFETEVLSATYDDASKRWRVIVRDREGQERSISANAVISAVGQLNRPSMPSLEGLDVQWPGVSQRALEPRRGSTRQAHR